MNAKRYYWENGVDGELNFNAAYGARSSCFDTQVTQNSTKNLEEKASSFLLVNRYNCLKLVQAYNTSYHLSLIYLSPDTTN